MQREHGITVNDDVTCDICGKENNIFSCLFTTYLFYIMYFIFFFKFRLGKNIAKKSLPTHQRNMHGISPTGFMCHKCNKLLKVSSQKRNVHFQLGAIH